MIARWIPYSLSQRHKEERIECAATIQRILRRTGIDDRLVITDEKFVFFRSLGTKQSNSAWVPPDGDKPRVQRRVQGEQKRMIIVAVTFSGRCHFEMLEKSETVDAQRYKHFLMNTVHNFSRHVVPLTWKDMLVMHDNARSHISRLVKDFLENRGVTLVKQPPLSPDFNLLDRFVFGDLENARCGIDFNSERELKQFLTIHLRARSAEGFLKQFQCFKDDLEAIVQANSNYLLKILLPIL